MSEFFTFLIGVALGSVVTAGVAAWLLAERNTHRPPRDDDGKD